MRFALVSITLVASAFLIGADAGVPVAPKPTPAPASPVWGGAPVQDAVLARAMFLVRRDVCVLVEADAPQLMSWDTDKSGTLAPMKTQVPRCDATAPLHALLYAGASALALAHKDQPPTPIAAPFSLEAIDAAFVGLVGKPLVRSREATKTEGETIQSYDASAIEAAFGALYAKPSETRLGVPLQKLFDATLKDELALQLRDLELITKNKKVLASEAKKLVDGAKKGTGAHGKDAWRAALNRLVTSDDAAANIDPRLVGFALRRQADGTLETLLTCLRIILADYGARR